MNSRFIYVTLGVFQFIFILSCNKNFPVDLKKGKFEIYFQDSLTSIIERKGKVQLEYSIGKREKELFFINWINDSKYTLEEIVKNDSLDYHPLIVNIDSIRGNNYYQTSFIEGYESKFSSRIVKISDDVSEEFRKSLKEIGAFNPYD